MVGVVLHARCSGRGMHQHREQLTVLDTNTVSKRRCPVQPVDPGLAPSAKAAWASSTLAPPTTPRRARSSAGCTAPAPISSTAPATKPGAATKKATSATTANPTTAADSNQTRKQPTLVALAPTEKTAPATSAKLCGLGCRVARPRPAGIWRGCEVETCSQLASGHYRCGGRYDYYKLEDMGGKCSTGSHTIGASVVVAGSCWQHVHPVRHDQIARPAVLCTHSAAPRSTARTARITCMRICWRHHSG